MPCTFSIAALPAAALDTDDPLVASLDDQLQRAAPDLRRIINTDGSVMWTGTFAFQSPDNRAKRARTNVTIYKASKRVRIQPAVHDVSPDEAGALEDLIASLLGATIVSRHQARESSMGVKSHQLREEPPPGWWKAWIPPRQSDPGMREQSVQGPEEPGTYEAE